MIIKWSEKLKTVILRILYIAMILLGLFGLYTFVFVSHVSLLKKVVLIIIAIGIILSGASGILNTENKNKGEKQ